MLQELGAVPPAQDSFRLKYVKKYAKYTDRNFIAYYSGWQEKLIPGTAQAPFFSINDDDKHALMTVIHRLDRSKGLDLFLHTPGGDLAATVSIVDYLRNMFGRDIRAVVPQLAMSAGTMIACACKEIVLGKHSNLGPIDPQIGGIPAHGILAEFQKAASEIKKDPDKRSVWQPIIAKYHPTLIGSCQRAIKSSESIVEEWLCDNMFHRSPPGKRRTRASAVIQELTDQQRTIAHNHHFHFHDLKLMGLKVTALESDQHLQELTLSVHHAYKLTLAGTTAAKILENQNGVAHVRHITAKK